MSPFVWLDRVLLIRANWSKCWPLLPARANSGVSPWWFQGGLFTECTNTKLSFATKRVRDKEAWKFFPRQEYWSGLPFSSPGNLSNPGMEPKSPAVASGILYHWATWGTWYISNFTSKSNQLMQTKRQEESLETKRRERTGHSLVKQSAWVWVFMMPPKVVKRQQP